MLNQYVIEFNMRKEALHTRLNIPSSISLDDHIEYQRYRRAAGEPVSLLEVVATTIKCPTLPISMKLRTALKIVINRW